MHEVCTRGKVFFNTIKFVHSKKRAMLVLGIFQCVDLTTKMQNIEGIRYLV